MDTQKLIDAVAYGATFGASAIIVAWCIYKTFKWRVKKSSEAAELRKSVTLLRGAGGRFIGKLDRKKLIRDGKVEVASIKRKAKK